MAGPLVSTAELARHLDDPDWLVIDCRHDLADPAAGLRAYREGHIPGAHFLSIDEDLSGPRTGANGRHPLPARDALAARLGQLGVRSAQPGRPALQVIAYDAQGGLFASRAWWLLRWLGHAPVAVLDGGWQRWVGEQRPVSTAAPRPQPEHFQAQPGLGTADAGEILAALGSGRLQLIDARAPDRFRGENETLDPVGGHIPGARNRFYRDNLAAEGHFKPAAQLRAEWQALLGAAPAGQTVHQCGSGISACHNLLALEVAGLGGGLLYPGSWSEWCADPARPRATGNAP
jgi:thiosulfate/3-mercaptopyruvate sulfurtransferase